MTAWPSSVFLGLMMISKSIAESSMTPFKAIQPQSAVMVGVQKYADIQTLEINPDIVRVEDLEFPDCMVGVIQKQSIRGCVTY